MSKSTRVIARRKKTPASSASSAPRRPGQRSASSSTTPRASKKKPRARSKPRKGSRTRGHKARRPRRLRRSRVRLRRVIQGTTWFITKKTNDDQFFLRPDGAVDAVLLYALILSLNKYGLLLHELVFMSNHFHLVVTDVRGTLPDFMRDFLSETGKAIKIVLKGTRRIWSGDRYGSTTLLDLDAAERFMVYTRVNPTNAGLTLPEEWPGLTSVRMSYGDTIEAKRPDVYFSPRTRPEWVRCVLEPLPELMGQVQEVRDGIEESATSTSEESTGSGPASSTAPRTDRREERLAHARREAHHRRCIALKRKIDRATRVAVEKILERMKRSEDKSRRGLAGSAKVRKASRLRRGNHDYGKLNPLFATTDKERLSAAIQEHRVFLARHELAKQRFAKGEHRVLFPAGTYGYREVLGVRVRKGSAAA